MRWLRLFSAGLFVLLGSTASAQVPPEKVLSTFKVSDGLEISLWASEPLFVNPTCMDIDHKGRVWVCESVNYRSKLRHQPLRRPEGDRILVLEDSNGTGKADKVTVFYQSPETLAPLGIAVAKDPVGPGYKVFVCQSPDILVFEDKDGDGKADGPPRKLLTGFNGYDHDHGVHGILIGPDGKLYFSIGDTGVKNLQSSDGKGKKWSNNTTDCRAGSIWRCDLDGKNLELLAHNFRNEYEPCVDSFGTVFVSDNDDDGNQQTRICYVMPGGNYGYHPRGPGQSHWHEEQPGVVPKILRTYFGSPTGICVYEGTLLPKKYQGQLLHTDAGPRHMRCYHLTPEGASYAVDREDMVTSTDNWFRPSDVCVAPDGSAFIADWYDPGVGGHGMGDTTRGRIFRVAPKGNKPSVPTVDLKTPQGLTAALASPALSVRYMAMAQLWSMDQKAAVDILEAAAVQKDNVWLRARALWQLGKLGRLRLVTTAFHDPDPRFRIQAIRILKDFHGQSPADYTDEWRSALLKDPSAAVRREALLALRDVDAAKARPLILALAKQYDGKDRFYLCAVGIAVGQDRARRDVILADFAREFPGWNDQVANLIWELRPAEVLPLLEKRLADAKLPAAQRGQVVDILASAEGADAGKALLKLLYSEVPPDVRDRIIDNLKQALPGKWRDLRQSPELADSITRLLDKANTRVAALGLIGAAERSGAIKKVVAIASDAKESPAIRTAAVQTLALLPSPDAVTALETLLKTDSPTLRTEVVQSLGRQAQQNEKRPATAPALKALQELTKAEDQDLTLRQAAVGALVGSRPGSIWLLQLHEKKQLPPMLVADTARLLRNSPYQDLRNKAMIAFPTAPKIDPKKLPSLTALAARKGDIGRGKLLLAASVKNDLQCLKCHTIAGFGGNVGPDLSMIGKKASRENLFESILYPSKAIADQYVTHVVETRKGQIISGLLIEETPVHVILRDANAKDTQIPKSDIESRAKDPKSIMPDNLMAYMTEDELVDMVEYLFTLKTPYLSLDYWHIAGPWANDAKDSALDRILPPEKQVNLKETYPDGKAGSVSWRVVRPNPQGYVDLKAFLASGSDNSMSYLYRRIESPADQEATILLGTDDCAKLWVNGALVYTCREHRAAKPEEDRVKVKLKKGANTLLLKITNGNGDHGFYLAVTSEQELKRLEEK